MADNSEWNGHSYPCFLRKQASSDHNHCGCKCHTKTDTGRMQPEISKKYTLFLKARH